MQANKKMTIVPSPPIGHAWESLMQLAYKEAEKAAFLEEVPVGAILVSKSGEILASSHNKSRKDFDPSAHAEILVIREAAKKVQNFRLLETYLIVTLEPCIMCLGAIREARIEGIIFGAYDRDAGAVCSCIDGAELNLKSPKPWFMGGVLEDKCSEILKKFFEAKR